MSAVPNGQRLTALRELEGETQSATAARLGISQAMVSKIEKAERPLGLEVVVRACSEYHVPEGFFFVAPSVLDISYPTFRKHSAAKLADERRIVRRYKEASRSFAAASAASGYHELRLPPGLENADVEVAALRIREAVGVPASDPVPNVARLLERLGFGVIVDLDGEVAVDDPKHAGISIPANGIGRPLIALAKPMRGEDQRMTLAHELGHHIWDRSHSLPWTSTRSPEERRAYDFAGALLMPKAMVVKRVTENLNLVGYLPIKAEYGVGVDAIVMRAKKLGMISPERVRSLFIQLSARGWRRQEPVEVVRERPLLFGQSMERAVGLTGLAVEKLTALPAGMVFRWMERTPEPGSVVDLASWRIKRIER